MNRDDQLWELLGKAKQPSVSPFFARNVLRAIRQEPKISPVERFRRGFRRWAWRLAAAGVCVAATFMTIFPSAAPQPERHEALSGQAVQIVASPDYEVIKHLDELVADEESSVWLDDSVN